jgi:hypothetical protein
LAALSFSLAAAAAAALAAALSLPDESPPTDFEDRSRFSCGSPGEASPLYDARAREVGFFGSEAPAAATASDMDAGGDANVAAHVGASKATAASSGIASLASARSSKESGLRPSQSVRPWMPLRRGRQRRRRAVKGGRIASRKWRRRGWPSVPLACHTCEERFDLVFVQT